MEWEIEGVGYASTLMLMTELIGIGFVWGTSFVTETYLGPGIMDALIVLLFTATAHKTLVNKEELSKLTLIAWFIGAIVFTASFATGLAAPL